jgi:hypothetical protein
MVVKQLAGRADLFTTQRYARMVASDPGVAIASFAEKAAQRGSLSRPTQYPGSRLPCETAEMSTSWSVTR